MGPRRYFHKDAEILVGTTSLQDVVPIKTNHITFLTKITLSITTHAATTVTMFDDSIGPILAAHTDAVAGAGILSVVRWNFKEDGISLSPGSNLDVALSAAGMVARLHIEGYYQSSTVAAFSPLDISNLVYWISPASGLFQDAAGTTPVTADGQSVQCWTDLVHGWKATEGTTPPTFKTNILNGFSTVRFDGVNDFLSVESASFTALGMQNSAGRTVFLAYSANNIGVAGSRDVLSVSIGTSATTNRWIATHNATNAAAVGQFGRILDIDGGLTQTSAGGAIVAGVPAIQSSWWDTANASAQSWVNGVSAVGPAGLGVAGNTSDTPSLRIRIGSSVANVEFFNGDLFELLTFNRALTATERIRVERYLGRKYGVIVQ